MQIGLGKHTGALPLLGAFDAANDLGYFSELTVPGTCALVRRGIITSRRAELHPNKFVSCYAGNGFEDLDLIEDNPLFEFRSYEYTNDPKVISKHRHMLTLNGALMVDLSGQIVSIPRELADTIVTDHGIARLLGKSVCERAEELINAAHPDHRDWLRDEAKRLYYP